MNQLTVEPTRLSATQLLAEARKLYDDPRLPFADGAANDGWRNGFSSGAEWMRLVLSHVRGGVAPQGSASFQRLGLIKYGLASSAALAWLAFVIITRIWPLFILLVPVFYAVEAQMVFLFPLALDGHSNLFRASRRWTSRAGGTWHVMWTVIGLAVTMLLGGFVGRGFIRSWALGCLGVLLWYEKLRKRYVTP